MLCVFAVPVEKGARSGSKEYRDHNMRYLGLTSEQLDRWQILMDMPMNEWPKMLQEWLKTNHTGQAVCGDALCCWVADYVRSLANVERKRYLRPKKI